MRIKPELSKEFRAPNCQMLDVGDGLRNGADYLIVQDISVNGEYVVYWAERNGTLKRKAGDKNQTYTDTLITKYNWKPFSFNP